MTAAAPHDRRRSRLLFLLPLLSLCVVFPLLLHGPSCGHDFGFHMQSWIDAGRQIRGGDPLPRWAFSPAFNAGEPRFIFYPPLSWLLGSLLMLLLPAGVVPAAYTYLALTAAALAMYRLARDYAPAGGAILAAAVYIANPYLLFTAFERTAYAELLAAAWMPLLFRAALTAQPRVVAVAVPLALLWLTNAPAAVTGTYALVLLILLRAAGLLYRTRKPADTGPLLLPAAGGLGLGLALPAFYLLPAAFERRYVQIAMAIIPNMRVEDNFLFGHTGYVPHNVVLHTASMVALEVIGLTAVALLAGVLRREASRTHGADSDPEAERRTLLPIAALGLLIALLLWHFTLPVWHLLPEMVFLQFPWRLLAVLGCVLGLGVAFALRGAQIPLALLVVLSVGWVSIATAVAMPAFRQGCEAGDLPAARVARFNTHHGVGPTDEYTPTDADNDQLRWDDPGWWLTTAPNAPGPGTVPNPAATIEDYDQPPPMNQTISGSAPMHLRLHLARPEALVLNLRDYPTWIAVVNGNPHPEHLQRDDGLLALALPAGEDTIDLRWHTTADTWAGDAVSLLALGVAASLRSRSRRIGA